MATLPEIDRVIGQAYECFAEQDGWADLLTSCVRLVGGDTGLIYFKSKKNCLEEMFASDGFDPAYNLKRYLSYYEARSPIVPLFKKNPEGQIRALGAFAFSAAYRKTEYFQDWVRPQGFGDMIGGHLVRNPHHYAWLSIRRAEQRGPYSVSEVRKASRLAIHLGRVMRLQTKFATERAVSHGLRESIESVEFGVFIVDANGRILFANRAADEIMISGDGLKSRQGRLVCEQPRDRAKLQAAIYAAARARSDCNQVAFDFCVTRSDAASLMLHVVPLPSAQTSKGILNCSTAAVFVIDPLRETGDVDRFARAHGLTPAECGILREILQCGGLVGAAARLHVAVSTARTHLQRVFQKTNTRSQAELVKLVTMSLRLR